MKNCILICTSFDFSLVPIPCLPCNPSISILWRDLECLPANIPASINGHRTLLHAGINERGEVCLDVVLDTLSKVCRRIVVDLEINDIVNGSTRYLE